MRRDGVAARARLVAGGASSGPGISRIPDDLASGLPSPQVGGAYTGAWVRVNVSSARPT